MFKKLLPLFLLLIFAAACSQKPTLEDAVSNRFQVGDEWAYQTRPGESLSTFIVTKIDKATIDGEEKTIIHIAVTNLAIDHPEGGQITAVPEMPFTEETLNYSALQPFNVVDPIPQEYLDAYQDWRERYLSGDAAVFQSTIATALDSLETSLQSANQ
ncbi:MAG: hypothetical protein WAM60_12485 [Candidatus Promineifilaceae bacterium]